MAAAVVRSGRRLAALLGAGTGPRAAAGERSTAPCRSAPGPGHGCGPGPCPALGRRSPVGTKRSRPAAGLRVPSGPFRGGASVRAAGDAAEETVRHVGLLRGVLVRRFWAERALEERTGRERSRLPGAVRDAAALLCSVRAPCRQRCSLRERPRARGRSGRSYCGNARWPQFSAV